MKQVDKQLNTNSTYIVFGWGEKWEDEKKNKFLSFLGVKIKRKNNGVCGKFSFSSVIFFLSKKERKLGELAWAMKLQSYPNYSHCFKP